MPFNGTGVFNRIYSWGNDAAAGLEVNATRMDTDTNDIAQGLSNCLTRDGQSAPTANIPMGGYRITGLGAGVLPTDAATIGSPNFSGTPTAPTPALGTNTDQIATAKMVTQAQFQTVLPAQPGGSTTYQLVTVGGSASWQAVTNIFDNPMRLAQAQALLLL